MFRTWSPRVSDAAQQPNMSKKLQKTSITLLHGSLSSRVIADVFPYRTLDRGQW